MKAFLMKCACILLAFSALICCALFAGCSSPSEAVITPVETTVPQTMPVAVTSLPTPVATLDLVVTLPPEQFVDLQLTKDRTDSTIHLLYNGGKGEVFVQAIRMVATPL